MIALTSKNLQKEVKDFCGLVIVVFTLPWDPAATKTLDFLSTHPANFPSYKLCAVDFEAERELVQLFTVRNLPKVFAIQNGKFIGPSVSTCEDETSLKSLLNGISV